MLISFAHDEFPRMDAHLMTFQDMFGSLHRGPDSPVRPRLVGRAGDVCYDAGQHLKAMGCNASASNALA